MNNRRCFFAQQKLILIDKPIAGYNWFLIKQGQHKYLFFDKDAITAGEPKRFHFKGSRSNLTKYAKSEETALY